MIRFSSIVCLIIVVISIDAKEIRTTGGTANGAKCKFPFIYNGKEHHTCANREVNVGLNGTVTYAKFCLTGDGNKWGYCLNYGDCHFPFIYENNTYEDCIPTSFGNRICATTSNFDKDKQWTYCGQICRDFPEENEDLSILKEKSFTNRKADGYCQFEPVISRRTNETLRHYSMPPCKTTFQCSEQDESVVNLINCKLDGTFDRMAVCPIKPDTNVIGSYQHERFLYKINSDL